MAQSAGAAAAGVFAGVLVLAAVAKLHAPASTAQAVGRVVPRRWVGGHPHLVAQSGRVLALGELVIAPVIALVPVGGTAIACALGASFVGAVSVAQRRGASCGCWGSLVPGRAGGAELARAGGMLGIAVVGLLADLGGGRRTWNTATLVLLASFVVTLIALGHLGARNDRSRSQIDRSLAGILLAANPSAPAAGDRPLWPWTNRRLVHSWRNDPGVLAAVDRLGQEAAGLRWDRMVVRHTGNGRRGTVSNGSVMLSFTDPDPHSTPPNVKVIPLARPLATAELQLSNSRS